MVPGSISSRYLLRAIDCEEIDCLLSRCYVEPELLLHGGDEERGVEWIGAGVVGCEIEREIEIALKAGFVHDHAIELPRERLEQLRDREAGRHDVKRLGLLIGAHSRLYLYRVFLILMRRVKLRRSLANRQDKNGRLFFLTMKLQLKAIGE